MNKEYWSERSRFEFLENFYASLKESNNVNQDVIEQLKSDAQQDTGYVEAVGKTAVLVEYNIRTRVLVDLPEGADINDETYWERIAHAAHLEIKNYVKTDKHYPHPDDIVEMELDTEVPYSPEMDKNKTIHTLTIENL